MYFDLCRMGSGRWNCMFFYIMHSCIFMKKTHTKTRKTRTLELHGSVALAHPEAARSPSCVCSVVRAVGGAPPTTTRLARSRFRSVARCSDRAAGPLTRCERTDGLIAAGVHWRAHRARAPALLLLLLLLLLALDLCSHRSFCNPIKAEGRVDSVALRPSVTVAHATR